MTNLEQDAGGRGVAVGFYTVCALPLDRTLLVSNFKIQENVLNPNVG